MYYFLDVTKKHKIFVDSGTNVSIFKPSCENYKLRSKEKIQIQGINKQQILITEAVQIPFAKMTITKSTFTN